MTVPSRYDADDAPMTTLRCLAILSAARDFGVARADMERVVVRLDPLARSPRADAAPTLVTPRALADALTDTLEPRPADEPDRSSS